MTVKDGVNLADGILIVDANGAEIESLSGNKYTTEGVISNDSGGKGNDSLWGGGRADTFIFCAGDGTDMIMDYDFNEGDLLQILDKNGVTTRNYSKASFDGDSLKLTAQGGGKIIFKNVTASSRFNINGDTYQITDDTLVKT